MQAILIFLFLVSAIVVNICHPDDKKEMEEDDDDEKEEVVQDTLKDDRKLVVENPFDYENMEVQSVFSEESAEKRGQMKRHKKVSQRRCCCRHGIYRHCDYERLDKNQDKHRRGHSCNNEWHINKRRSCKRSRKTILRAPLHQLS